MYEGEQIKERTGTVSNKDGKTWCITCNKRQPYDITTSIEKCDFERKGKRVLFNYLRLIPKCRFCKEVVYVPDIEDANCHAREQEYNAFIKEH